MRKQLKLLLLVATVLALFVMTMIVSSASLEAPYVALSGETVVSEHSDFADAYAVVKAGNADTIRIDTDVILNAGLSLDTDVVIDGAGHTIAMDSAVRTGWMFTLAQDNVSVTVKNATLVHNFTPTTAGRTAGLFFAGGDYVSLTVKNVVAENVAGEFINALKSTEKCASGITFIVEDSVLRTEHTLRVISFSSNEAGDKITKKNTVVLRNSTLESGTTGSKQGMFYGINTDVLVESSHIIMDDAAGYVFYGDTTKAENGTYVTITGSSKFEVGGISKFGSDSFIVFGTPGGNDPIEVDVKSFILYQQKNTEQTYTFHSGTYRSDSYLIRISNKIRSHFNIHGGTFIADKSDAVIRYESTVVCDINITGGEFHLSNAKGLIDLRGKVTESGLVLPAADKAVPGAIKIYLDSAAAANATAIKDFFKTDAWKESGAHFYITAWNLDANKLYTFAENFTGTLEECVSLVKAYVFQAPIAAYEELRSASEAQVFFSSGENQNLFVDIGVIPPFVIKDANVTVTINGGKYDALGTLANVQAGTLILNGCEMTAATTLVNITGGKLTVQDCKITATGSDALIVVGGAATVELKGANTEISTLGSLVSMQNAAGTVTVNEGSYAIKKGKPLFTGTVAGVVGKINIVKATFRLAGGSSLNGGTLTNDSYTLPTAAAAGDITFYLDAGSADSVEVQNFLSANQWYAAKARYIVIGWGEGEASLYEMTANFSGTLEDYKAMIRAYILVAPQINYEALRSESGAQVFFTTGANANLIVDYVTIPEMLPFVIKNSNITVTLTDWNYTTTSLLARVEAGKLVLNNCTFNFSLNDGAFIYVNGAEAALEISGGTFTGNASSIFDVTTGSFTVKGGNFVNTKGDLIHLNGAGAITIDPATPDTVLNFTAVGSILVTKNAAGAAVTINGGNFVGNYVENVTQRPANVYMFSVGAEMLLKINNGTFDNGKGNYIFDFNAADAVIWIVEGTFNGGIGWILADQEGVVMIGDPDDSTKSPVFTDSQGAAGNAFISIDKGAMVGILAGTYTASTPAYHMFYVKNGLLGIAGGTYTGSLFYATANSLIEIEGGTFTATGNNGVLFELDGTITTDNIAINAAAAFTVTDNAYIFKTKMNATATSAVLANAKITVTGYSKVGVTLAGETDITFASEADAKTFVRAYVASGTLTFDPETIVPTLKIDGKVNLTVTGGTWNYGADYLFNLVSGDSTVTITGGTFNSYGGGLLYLGGTASQVVIGNTENAKNAPKFNVTNGLGMIYNAADGSTITIHNGTFTMNDYLGCNGFTFAAPATVVINDGTFTVTKGASIDKNGNVENNTVLFYVSTGETNITIHGGTFKAARIVFFETAAGTLTINNGDFSSGAYSTLEANMFAFTTKKGATVTINGGFFRGNNFTNSILFLKSSKPITLNIYAGEFSKSLTWLYSKGPHNVTFDKLEGGTGPSFDGLNNGVGSKMEGGTPANYTPKGIWFDADYDAVVEFKAGSFELSASETVAIFMLTRGTFTFYDGVSVKAPYIMFRAESALQGTVTIKGGTYTGIHVANMFYFAADEAQTAETPLVGQYVIEGGTFNATGSATLFYIASLDEHISLLIKGGTFTSENVRLAFFTDATVMNVTIEDGNFSTTASRMFYLDENAAPLVIKGGTFVLEDKSGNKADDGIIYAVSKKASKVSVQGGVFVDNRKGNNQTFIKMDPLAVIEFAGSFKLYVAEQKTNFYYDSDDNAKSVPFAQTKETYNGQEYYVCFGYYNQNAPVIYNTPAIRPVMGAEGLTFSASVSAATATQLAELGTVSYGTLIFPTKYLANGWENGTDFLAALKAYATESGKSESSVYVMIEAKNGLETAEDGSITIRASLINIKDANHTLDLTGIAYAKVTAADGTVTYHYASHLSAGVTNNMRNAAKTALYDVNDKAIDTGLHVYCYASIMKKDSFSRYHAPFQDSLKKYLAEDERVPQW
ncbi:MAG: hypothetical protein IKA06_03705 [Clostridia bacterium]|nr:hypothetical protein [Clostridia bacterium]